MADEALEESNVGNIAAPFRNALVGGPFGSNLVSRDYASSGVPVIRGANMGNGRWVSGEFVFVTPQKADSLSANIARPGDIIFTQRGTLGQVAIVPQSGPDRYLISQSQMKLSVDSDKADHLFLYYLFTSAEQQEYIRQNAIQVGVPHTNLGILRKTPLKLPHLKKQKIIAHILGTLDDKIELNQRVTTTLEAMARTLFQNWFVDSIQTGIPKDWREVSLDSIATFLNGLALQKFPPDDGESLPVIKIAQLRKGNTDGADQANSKMPPEYIIQDGDVLFSWSGSLEVELWCGGRGALNQHLFKVTSNKYPKWFYFLWTRHHLPDFRETAAGKATTMGHIQRHHLTEAKVLVPTAEELQKMDQQMSPLIEKLVANKLESRTLANLRDTLLPKLLSGEVSVENLQKMLPILDV